MVDSPLIAEPSGAPITPPNEQVAGTDDTVRMTLQEESDAQDAAALAADATPPEPQFGDQMQLGDGEDVPEAFRGKSVADLMQSLKDSQARITELSEAGKAEANEEGGEEGAAPTSEAAQQKMMDDLAEYSTKLEANGTLDAADTAAVAKVMNIPEMYVERFLQGEQALANQSANQIFEVVGGKPQYEKLIAWADKFLPTERLQAFQSMMDTNNVDRMKEAVSGLVELHNASGGGAPTLMRGTQSAQGGLARYNSWAEVQADMATPAYTGEGAPKDPHFIQQVQNRLNITPNEFLQ